LDQPLCDSLGLQGLVCQSVNRALFDGNIGLFWGDIGLVCMLGAPRLLFSLTIHVTGGWHLSVLAAILSDNSCHGIW
jgi:hypothetical protein